MPTYAKQTEVTVASSRIELERILERYGATQFGYLAAPDHAAVAFELRHRQVRFTVPLPDRDDREFTHHSRGARTETAARAAWERACRQRWRALTLVVKAKLEAVESGISEFDQEFLAQIVLPGGATVYEQLGDQLQQLTNGSQAPLQLTGRS